MVVVDRLQWKARDQQKALENELASREEFMEEVGLLRDSLHDTQEKLRLLEEDTTIDLQVKEAQQQVGARYVQSMLLTTYVTRSVGCLVFLSAFCVSW